MKFKLLLIAAACFSFAASGCGGSSTSDGPFVPSGPAEKITVDPSSYTVPGILVSGQTFNITGKVSADGLLGFNPFVANNETNFGFDITQAKACMDKIDKGETYNCDFNIVYSPKCDGEVSTKIRFSAGSFISTQDGFMDVNANGTGTGLQCPNAERTHNITITPSSVDFGTSANPATITVASDTLVSAGYIQSVTVPGISYKITAWPTESPASFTFTINFDPSACKGSLSRNITIEADNSTATLPVTGTCTGS